MGILSSKYRTYVLNDFSSVKKAVFFILKFIGGAAGKYTVKECLPVQINPHSIKQEMGFSDGFEYDGCLLKVPDTSKDSGNILSVELEYSLYDEYNVATMGGMQPPSSDSISLYNPKAVTLEKLKSYAGKLFDDDGAKLRALFLWGDIEWFGALSSVDVEYTSFSRWGEPLSAKVDVKVQKEYLRDGDDDDNNSFRARETYSEKSSKPTESKGLGGLASASVKAYSAAADSVMLLEGVGGALR